MSYSKWMTPKEQEEWKAFGNKDRGWTCDCTTGMWKNLWGNSFGSLMCANCGKGERPVLTSPVTNRFSSLLIK